jgi:hypothetical protein
MRTPDEQSVTLQFPEYGHIPSKAMSAAQFSQSDCHECGRLEPQSQPALWLSNQEATVLVFAGEKLETRWQVLHVH